MLHFQRTQNQDEQLNDKEVNHSDSPSNPSKLNIVLSTSPNGQRLLFGKPIPDFEILGDDILIYGRDDDGNLEGVTKVLHITNTSVSIEDTRTGDTNDIDMPNGVEYADLLTLILLGNIDSEDELRPYLS